MTPTSFHSHLAANIDTIEKARQIIFNASARTPAQQACFDSLNAIRRARDEESRIAALQELIENSEKVIAEAQPQ